MELLTLLIPVAIAIVGIAVCVILYFRFRTSTENTQKPNSELRRDGCSNVRTSHSLESQISNERRGVDQCTRNPGSADHRCSTRSDIADSNLVKPTGQSVIKPSGSLGSASTGRPCSKPRSASTGQLVSNPGSASTGRPCSKPRSASAGQLGINPGSASNVQLVSNPGSASNGQVGSKPRSASADQLVGNPGSASAGQLVGNPGSASAGQLVGNPGSASNDQLVGKPRSASAGQLVSSPESASNGQVGSSPGSASNGQMGSTRQSGVMRTSAQSERPVAKNPVEEMIDQGVKIRNFGNFSPSEESDWDKPEESAAESLKRPAKAVVFIERCSAEMENMTNTRLFTDDLYEQSLNRFSLADMDAIVKGWTKNANLNQVLVTCDALLQQAGDNLGYLTGNKYVRSLFLYRDYHGGQSTPIVKLLSSCANVFVQVKVQLDSWRGGLGEQSHELELAKSQITRDHELNIPTTYELYTGYSLNWANESKVLPIYVESTLLFDKMYYTLVSIQKCSDDTVPEITTLMRYELGQCQKIYEEIIAIDTFRNVFMVAFVDLVCYLCKSSLPEFQVLPNRVTLWMEHLGNWEMANRNEEYYKLIVSPYWKIWERAKKRKQIYEDRWRDEGIGTNAVAT